MTLVSCSNVETLIGAAQVAAEVQAAESQTPYATVEELDAITNGTVEYVYWRVARTFALMELESFRAENGWDGAKMSETPVLIFAGKSKAKYYEFHILRHNQDLGAITAIAQKKDGNPIAYIIPSSREYDSAKTRGGEKRIIANDYSNVVYGRISRSGERVELSEDTEQKDSLDAEENIFEFALKHPEYFTNAEYDIAEVMEAANRSISSNRSFWNSSETIMSNLLYFSTNDDLLNQFFQMNFQSTKSSAFNKGVVAGNSTTLLELSGWWDKDYVIDKLNLKYSKFPRYWCVPMSVAMMLYYYDLKYPGKHLTSRVGVGAERTKKYLEIQKEIIEKPSRSYRKGENFSLLIYDDLDHQGFLSNMQVTIDENVPLDKYPLWINRTKTGYQIYFSFSQAYTGKITIHLSYNVYFKIPGTTVYYRNYQFDWSGNNLKVYYVDINDVSVPQYYDQYYRMGCSLGIDTEKEWSETGYVADTETIVREMKYASDYQLKFTNYTDYFLWFKKAPDGNTVYDRVKSCVNSDDIVILIRNKTMTQQHCRLAIGYKQVDSPYQKDMGGLQITGWNWIFPIIEWVSKMQTFYNTSRYVLVTDNGDERSGNSQIPSTFISMNNYASTTYCRYIFWEDISKVNYSTAGMIWRR